jgi:uncharacterized protein (TIGR03435 family)
MQELDDTELLRQYTENDSEEAFGAIVSRHINKVYSVALRQTGNAHQAEEITQAVFVILAKKARGLSNRVILSGWLYQTARLASVTFIRSEIRRARREQEAHTMQSILNEPAMDEIWKQMSPLLDAAMAKLNETDHNAVLLRFFDGKSIKEVGTALGTTEDTAKKRLSRALEKLQRFFAKRGMSSTTAIIAGTISSNSVQAAPAMLAKAVTVIAIAKGATASTATLTLAKGALKVMAWTKVKTAIVTGAVILFTAATATITVKEIHEHAFDNSWRTMPLNPKKLNQVSAQVRILPSKYIPFGGYTDHDKIMGIAEPAIDVVGAAYGFYWDTRIVLLTPLPDDSYDFIASLPSGNREALQMEIRRKFGVLAKREMVKTNVLLLTVKYPNAPGLKPSTKRGGGSSLGQGRFTGVNLPISHIVGYAEVFLNTPVIDRTGLNRNFDFDLKWDEEWDDRRRQIPGPFKQALLDQLGLELVPTNMPIEMLVVEKAQ